MFCARCKKPNDRLWLKTCSSCAVKQKVYNKAWRETNPEKARAAQKAWVEANPEKAWAATKAWREANSEKHLATWKAYYEANREEFLANSRAWKKANPERIKTYSRIYQQHKLGSDLNFKLRKYLRTRLRNAIKRNVKTGSAVKDLGCSISELRVYLETQFQPGMTWENWERCGWHIDHIKPLTAFDLTDQKQLLEACNYTNLRPMWAKDNLRKGGVRG